MSSPCQADSDGVRRIISLATVLALLLAGCADGDSESTTTEPSDSPFTLEVAPSEYMPIMPGQRFVIVATASGGSGPVTMQAEVGGDADVTPPAATVQPDEVIEFTVVARPESVDSTVSFELRAQRGNTSHTHPMNLQVVDWSDDLEPLATELRERFVTYLAENHPDFGITADTDWTPTITKPQILVVMHYLFFSEDWEMGIMWHVTVPEHAWSRMYLRPRDGMTPTFGLEIPSYLDPVSQPGPWEPPAEIDR
jgi:hypothetical protein